MLFFYIFPLIASAVLALVLALHISRYIPTPGAIPLIAMILAAGFWSAGYALEIASYDLNTKLIWAQIEYLGIVAIAPAWIIFCARYLDSPHWLARSLRNQFLMGVFPAITLALAMTSQYHNLVWRQVTLRTVDGVQLLEISHGPWFTLELAYTYFFYLMGSIWLASRLSGSDRLQRRQIILTLIGSLVPLLGNLLYVTPFNPVPGLDWTPFSFTIAGLFFVLSLFRFQLMEIIPIAYHAIFERIEDLILVLDSQDRVIDMNPAAEQRLATLDWRSARPPLNQVSPVLAAQIAPENELETARRTEINLGDATHPCDYEVRITPLGDKKQPRLGRLVILHDITQRKQEKELLRQARDELEIRVGERTKELRQANQKTLDELDRRSIAEQALRQSETTYRALFENANDAILLLHPDGSIWQVNQKAADMLGYTREELARTHPRDILAPGEYPKRQSNVHAILNAEPVPMYVRYYIKKDGTTFPAEVNLSLIRGPDDKSSFIQIIARDISERMAAEQEQSRLLAEISQSREQLRALAARLQEVREFERRQIAAELHDRVGQNLTGLSLNLKIIQNHAPPECAEVIKSRLKDSQRLVEETTRQVRDVLADLVPPLLDEFGVVSALNWYGKEFSRRTGIGIQIFGPDQPRLKADIEIALFRIAQKALNNIAQHAGATQVTIAFDNDGLKASLKIEDNGRGFDTGLLRSPRNRLHLGTVVMRERAAAVGGQLIIQSTIGKGTIIEVKIEEARNDD